VLTSRCWLLAETVHPFCNVQLLHNLEEIVELETKADSRAASTKVSEQL